MLELYFKEWMLILETATISQLLKQEKSDNAKSNKSLFRKTLKNIMPGINEKFMDLLVNYFLYQHLKRADFTMNNAMLYQVKDYLTARIDDANLRKKLNDPEFDFSKLKQMSDDWHESLQKKARPAGGAGKELIDLSHLGANWQGWKWLLLGKGYCKEESDAGGHCGNANPKPGDDIISLRDAENKVHATFIINKGMLGEMKGWGNHKPSPKLYPAIIELLKHSIVEHIRGGGYAPQHNFRLEDLDENDRKSILSMKPMIDIKSYLSKQTDPKVYMDLIEKLFPDKNRKPSTFAAENVDWFENPVTIFYGFYQLSDYIKYLYADTFSTGLPLDLKFWDDIMDGNYYGVEVTEKDMTYHFENDLNISNQNKLASIIGRRSWRYDDRILQALYDSCVQTYEHQTLPKMRNWLKSHFDNSSNGSLVKTKLFFDKEPHVIVFLDLEYFELLKRSVNEQMDNTILPIRSLVNQSINVNIQENDIAEIEFSKDYFNMVMSEKLDEIREGTYV